MHLINRHTHYNRYNRHTQKIEIYKGKIKSKYSCSFHTQWLILCSSGVHARFEDSLRAPITFSRCHLCGRHCCCCPIFSAPFPSRYTGGLHSPALEGRSGAMTHMTNKWLTSAREHKEPWFSMSSSLLPQQSLKPRVQMWCHKMAIQCPSSSNNGEMLWSHVGFEAWELLVPTAQTNLSWRIPSVNEEPDATAIMGLSLRTGLSQLTLPKGCSLPVIASQSAMEGG